MLCPLRNTFRKTHESSRKPIKTTSLKPGDGITLMRIFEGKSKFLNKWLEQPQYHAWLRNSPDIHKAHCKCCNKSFDISSMGESALQSHMKIFDLEHKWTRLMLCPLRNKEIRSGKSMNRHGN
jgi:hypothetical protein